eukprot:4530155-Amphidinium_carterae.2
MPTSAMTQQRMKHKRSRRVPAGGRGCGKKGYLVAKANWFGLLLAEARTQGALDSADVCSHRPGLNLWISQPVHKSDFQSFPTDRWMSLTGTTGMGEAFVSALAASRGRNKEHCSLHLQTAIIVTHLNRHNAMLKLYRGEISMVSSTTNSSDNPVQLSCTHCLSSP